MMKILYVEDEIPHLELTKRTLEKNLKENFDLHHCASYQEAITYLDQSPEIDIILTDYRLPDGSGMDILNKAQDMPTPPAVILVTGQGDEQIAVAALKAGAADYLVKQSEYLQRLPFVILNAIAQNKLNQEQAAKQDVERKYKFLIEKVPAVVFWDDISDDETTVYISPRIIELTGYTPEEWYSGPHIWKKGIHPDDRERILDLAQISHVKEERFQAEYRFIRRDGRIIWIKEDTNLIRDDDGKPLYWQGILLDITNEVESRAILKASEERFRRIFHATPIATCVVTLEEGRFMDANLAFLHLTGIPLEKLLGHTSNDLGFWEKSDDRETFIRRLKQQGYLKNIEHQFINVPQGPRDTIAYYELIELDRTNAILAMFYDVTEQKRVQAALLAERDFALQVLNNMGQGLTVTNADSIIEYANPAYASMIGYPVEEIIGKRHVDFTTKSNQSILEAERDQRKHGITSTYEINLLHKNGTEVPVTITGVPRISETEITGAIAVITDLTLQKQTERALARQVKELKILHAATVAGTEGTSEDEIIEKFVEALTGIYNEVCGVLLLDEQGKSLLPHPSYFGVNISKWKTGTPLTQGNTGKAILEGRELRIGDVTSTPEFLEVATGIYSELCVPIRVNKRIIGVVNVESKKRDAYDDEDEQFLVTVANTLGSALERLRLFSEEQQRARELNVLYAGAKSLSQSLDTHTIAEDLLSTIDSLVDYEFSSIYLLDEKSQMLSLIALNSKSRDSIIYETNIKDLPVTKRKLGEGIIGWVAEHGTPIRTGDVSQEKRYLPIIKNIRSELCVPLSVRGKVIGALNIETTTPNAYSKRDENLLVTLAGSAAIAFDNARLYETERIRRAEADALREATASLSLHIDLEPLLEQILASIHKIIAYDSASIFLENKHGKMTIVAANGFIEQEKIIGKIVSETAKWHEIKESRQPIILADAQLDTTFEKWDGAEEIRGWLGIPMIAQSKIVGFITLDSHKVNRFSEHDATLAQTFASSAAVAIQKAILFKAEREQHKREESMLELMRVTTSTLELDDIMQTILTHMLELIPSTSGTIQLLEGEQLRIAATHGFKQGILIPGQILPLKDSFIKQRALKNLQPVWINNTKQDPNYIFMDGTENINSFMVVPLVYKGLPIGLATLDNTSTNRYTPDDAEFAFAIANQASIAIGNARLYQDALKASEKRAILHRISQDIARFNLDPEQVYKSMHESTQKLMPCDVFMIILIDEITKINKHVYTVEGDTKHDLSSNPAYSGLPGKVLQHGKSLILSNGKEIEKEGFSRFGSPRRVHSVIAVPMRIGERIIGIISAQSYEANSYGDEEQALLEMLASHAATAIENRRLYNETERRLREMETINRVSSYLRTTQSQDEMLETLLNEALAILNAKHGSVWIFDHQENMIVQRKAYGSAVKTKAKKLKQTEGIVGHVFSSGEIYISREVVSDPYVFADNRESFVPGIGSAGIPIQSTAGTLGVLMIHLETERWVTENINLLTTLAEITGNAIHRADLFDQSQEQVHKLTTLRDIDSAITSSTDLRVTLNILMDHTLRHLKVDAADILLYRPELQSLTYCCNVGFLSPSPSRPPIRIGDGLTGQVVMKGRIVHIPDLKNMEGGLHDPYLAREGFVLYVGIPVIVKGQIKGVFEIFNRSPFTISDDWMQFLMTLAGQAAIAIDNSQLFDNLQKSNEDLKRAYDTTLEGWARALELRDRETEGHTRRVTDLTMQLARYMNVHDDELENIYRGVLLHDIGKMGVPDQILKKTGPLTKSEWAEMRKHPQYAYDLLSPIHYLRPALDIPYYHHEHWDGSGYPHGIKGEEIPLSARIFSVVDVWDALLSNRPYRKAWKQKKAVDYLKRVSGTILDPTIVEVFLKMIVEEEENKTG